MVRLVRALDGSTNRFAQPRTLDGSHEQLGEIDEDVNVLPAQGGAEGR